ncbi:MAG: NHLP bacteriocin system secretion protein, partial [Gammaproteobacteria bacterium]
LQAYIYVSAMDGKKVQAGMPAHIKISMAQSEIYGTVMGQVIYISQYPVTTQSLMGTMQNDAIVQNLLQGGTAFEVISQLIPDATTKSGYRWTTKKGPPIKLQSGTFCSASIEIEKRHPISLILPSTSM